MGNRSRTSAGCQPEPGIGFLSLAGSHVALRERRAVWVQAGVTVLVAPPLLFPTNRPVWAAGSLLVLVAAWILRWIAFGRPGSPTPFDVSLVVFCLASLAGLWASAFREATLVKLTGLIWGLAVFRAMADLVRLVRGLRWATAGFLLVGLVVGSVGLVGTAWVHKVPLLAPLYGILPTNAAGLPGAEGGIHPNELAGALTLFLPVALVVTLTRALRWRGRGSYADLSVVVAGAMLVTFFGVELALAQSRSAWLGVGVGLGVMAGLRWRRSAPLWLCLAMLLVVVVLLTSPGTGAGSSTSVGAVSFEGRREIWDRALVAVRDFPLTGLGLGAFRHVVPVLYPLHVARPGAEIGHAHNVFLQVGVDLGLPGLVAYLALVGTALWLAYVAVRRSAGLRGASNGREGWLALGIVGSLVSYHVYGLTDALALGAKPGVALWMLLAMASGVWQRHAKDAEPRIAPLDAEGIQAGAAAVPE